MLCIASAVGCVSSELEVPANHPGHPDARPGRVQSSTALTSANELPPIADESETDAPGRHDQHSGHEHGTQPSAAPAAEGTKPAESSPANPFYTCPMHPEIERKEPGKCPICGMKLVPKKDAK